ncbi:glycine zipper family protein [Massilia forsythiae]|uniref:Glycine zipper family protein n=1 Tax=Massilia forsythiae TaxID=2728020 RepID=A0A7Z2ZU99_9BURK|nr:glycine zipper family protein [Massilia forsythiae]QJE02080.1 glycine zipper family protein [Massilia forsythiae]
MSAFEFETLTNTAPGSRRDVTSHHMPARAFFFIVVDEVGKEGFLVRKVYATPTSPYLSSMNLSPLAQLSQVQPEKYGLMPKKWGAPPTVAEHVMGNSSSSYVSSSSIFPEGSPRFDGRSVFIDIAKAKAAGARLVSTEEILASLNQYKAQNPHLAKRVDKIAMYVQDFDREVLVHSEKVPPKAIFNTSSLKVAKVATGAGRVVQVLGIVLTAYDLEQASEKSFQAKSVKPISAEVIRQAGGWGAAAAGFKLGGVAGAALGIETGPGAVLTGLAGGIIFGAAGYFGADWVADHIDKN